MVGKKLNRQFFARPALAVAQDILGKFLVHRYQGQKIAGKIVEVEVYAGTDDQASHAFGGKKTARNAAEYLVGGHVYIYLVYGMHWQFNISTGQAEEPECILIRALESVGVMTEIKIENEKIKMTDKNLKSINQLASGPGKLCRWLKLDKSFYGYDLCQKGAQLHVEDRGVEIDSNQIINGPRIGIDYAGPYWSKVPWRFWIKDNKFVSK